MTNPFDDTGRSYVVLRNSLTEYSLWPVGSTVPDAGRSSMRRTPGRRACPTSRSRRPDGVGGGSVLPYGILRSPALGPAASP
ncbi:MbtH family NRPS accessory protein [Streptomyces sp. NPDC046976]|uniref:MbtH family NRPS accessory protein n=1 Tax=Streptomyces sp. NPDC046976 TaxID=3155258 RepID=UPI0033F4A01F